MNYFLLHHDFFHCIFFPGRRIHSGVMHCGTHRGGQRISRRSQFYYVGLWKQIQIIQHAPLPTDPWAPSPPLESNLGSVELLQESCSETSAELSCVWCMTKPFRPTANTSWHNPSSRVLSRQFSHSLPSAPMFPPSKPGPLPLDYKTFLLLAELWVVLSSLPLQSLHCSIKLWVDRRLHTRQSPNCSICLPTHS